MLVPVAGERSARWAFKDGKLLMFEGGKVVVLRAWPRCAAWSREKEQAWRGVRPRFKLVSSINHAAKSGYVAGRFRSFLERERQAPTGLLEPERAAELGAVRERLTAGWDLRHQAARAFIGAFPPGVLPLVLDLPERQWHMVQLIAHCPGALDLAATNRGLAVALASSWVFHSPGVQRPLRAARSLVRGRRAAIAGWLGFPATRSAVSVLGKVRADALSVERLLWLRGTLREAALPRALQHLPVLTAPVLRVLCDVGLRRSAGHSLLEELATGPDSRESTAAPYVLRDVLEAARLVGLREPPVVRSLAELRWWHREIIETVNRVGLRETVALVLPPPPVPGNAAIVPLTSPLELLDEGRAMHHCVATYARRIAAGTAYIYRVLGPERATLSIARAATGPGWKVDQISGVANEEVGHATRLAVTAWLRASGMGWGALYRMPSSAADVFGADDIPF
jgi:hypothetical protein